MIQKPRFLPAFILAITLIGVYLLAQGLLTVLVVCSAALLAVCGFMILAGSLMPQSKIFSRKVVAKIFFLGLPAIFLALTFLQSRPMGALVFVCFIAISLIREHRDEKNLTDAIESFQTEIWMEKERAAAKSSD